MILNELGFNEYFENKAMIKRVGRVSFVGRSGYKVMMNDGEYNGVLKGSLLYTFVHHADYPTIGDWVDAIKIDDDKVIITNVYKRVNFISRKVSGVKTQEQILASNIDNVFICLSLNENFNINRLERYLFAITTSVNPVIVLTKKDLSYNYMDNYHLIKKRYPALDVTCVSAIEKDYDGLDHYFQYGKTSVLIGSSGVGKSTLINSLFGEDIMTTGDINQKNDKGRHTTSYRQLIFLGDGKGCLIDTPGMRELSVWNSDEGDSSFSDIITFSKHCKFKDCSHINEIDCAVKNAINEGHLTIDRYHNYLKLIAEYKYTNHQKDYITKKEYNENIKKRCQQKKKTEKRY